ncbi:MAG: hypothetical protein ABWY25_12420 [Paenisporosarcina sp.]
MTLIFADGFEDGSAGWVLTNISVGAGRFGNGLTVTSGSGIATASMSSTAGPIIAGFAFKPTGIGGGFFTFAGGVADSHVSLIRGSSGEIIVHNAGTVRGSSAIGVLPSGAWSYVEVKAVIHATTGSVIVRVNGVQILSLTNIDTADSSTMTSWLKLGATPSTNGTIGNAFDDFYLVDTTGTVNNDFLGEIAVEHLRPASDDTAQWLGTDGNSVNNYDLVDEAGAFNGTDYVASSTIGHRDLYVPTPSSRPITSPVVAVMVSTVAQKTDVGTRTVKMCVKEGAGGTVRQSAELGLPSSFGEINAIFERKGDGSQFTVADVNNLRFGIEVVS